MPSADPFKLAPVDIPDNFVWSGKNFHLTYPCFVSMEGCLHAACGLSSVPQIGFSHVQEIATRPNGTEYQHTHFALMFASAIKVQGCHKMDVRIEPEDAGGFPDYIHPQVQPKVTIKQMEQIFVSYHRGRKFNIVTGKIEYTPPFALNQKLPPLFDFTRAVLDEVIAAPNLYEAVIAAEVKPRTVSDVKALREDAASNAKRHKSMYPADSFISGVIADDFQIVHLYGPTGIGKTKYALGGVPSVKSPLLVKPFNSVAALEFLKKNFNSKIHDCLVLDEVDLRFMKREEVICFFDMDEAAVFNIRFTLIDLPPVRKILLSNPHPSELYQANDPAIARRVEIIYRSDPLYKSAYVNGIAMQPGRTPCTAPQDTFTQICAPARTPLAPLPLQPF